MISNFGRFAAILLAFSSFGLGQSLAAITLAPALPVVPKTADEAIIQMASAAGVIFVGQVLAIRPPKGYAGSPEAAAEGIVEVDFHVEEVVRGPSRGSVYTLREWSGLWIANGQRYRIGQRLLLFLRPPNVDGLSSPVGGAVGAIPLRGGGSAPGPDDSATRPAEWMVDLRWVQTQTLRNNLRRGEPVRPPVRRFSIARFDEDPAPALIVSLPGPWLEVSSTVAPQSEPLSQVINLCRGSARLRDAPR